LNVESRCDFRGGGLRKLLKADKRTEPPRRFVINTTPPEGHERRR
jgi:hypothetical protein